MLNLLSPCNQLLGLYHHLPNANPSTPLEFAILEERLIYSSIATTVMIDIVASTIITTTEAEMAAVLVDAGAEGKKKFRHVTLCIYTDRHAATDMQLLNAACKRHSHTCIIGGPACMLLTVGAIRLSRIYMQHPPTLLVASYPDRH